MNIKIGTTSVPNYQDATFKVNIPVGKKSNISFFGIGGLSKIDLVVSTLKDQATQLYGESDRDQYFTSNTGFVGGTFSHTISNTAFTKLTVAQTANDVFARHDFIFRNPVTFQLDSLPKNILGYDFLTQATVAHWYLNKKISARQTLKVGVVNNYYSLNFQDSSRQFPPTRQDRPCSGLCPIQIPPNRRVNPKRRCSCSIPDT